MNRDSLLGLPLTAFAVWWPWGVYGYVPGLGLTLTALGALAILPAAIAAPRRRFPLEYLWPGALLAALLVLSLTPERTGRAVHGAALVLLFFAVVHLSLRPKQVLTLLRVSAVSAIAMNALSALSLGVPGLLPTAYPAHTEFLAAFRANPYPFCGPISLAQGGFINAMALLVMGHWAFRSRTGSQETQRLMLKGLGAACLLGPAYLVAMLVRCPGCRDFPRFTSLGTAGAAAALALVYVIARTWAKLEVARRDFDHPHARFFQLLLLAGFAYALFVPLQPRASHAVLLGLLAASSRPYASSVRLRRHAPWLFAAVLLPAALLNGFQVFPSNAADPRNYNPAMGRAFQRGDHEHLRQLILYVRSVAPGERGPWLWTSRLALRLDRPYQAAAALNVAASPPPPGARRILPPPAPEALASAGAKLRDYCSALPDPHAHFAYQTTLVAAGEGQHALAALKLRLPPGLADGPRQGESRHTAPLIAWLLGDMDLTPLLENEWTPAERAALLKMWRVRTQAGPEAGGTLAPLAAFAVMYRGASLQACAIALDGRLTQSSLPQPLPRGRPQGASWGWLLSGELEGGLLARLKLETATGSSTLFEAGGGGGLELRSAGGPPYEAAAELPDYPAILICSP